MHCRMEYVLMICVRWMFQNFCFQWKKSFLLKMGAKKKVKWSLREAMDADLKRFLWRKRLLWSWNWSRGYWRALQGIRRDTVTIQLKSHCERFLFSKVVGFKPSTLLKINNVRRSFSRFLTTSLKQLIFFLGA